MEWKKIKTFRGPDRREVDLWLRIYPSPRSMGWSDAFRVPNAWRKDGRWFHNYQGREKELEKDYITHWMPLPSPPGEEK